MALATFLAAGLSGCQHTMPEVHRDELLGTWVYSASDSTVGDSVPRVEITLNEDNTASVVDFPIRQLRVEELSDEVVSGEGSWEFQQVVENIPTIYDDQPGIRLVVPQPSSPVGDKAARYFAIEKSASQVRLVLYMQYPDVLGKNYVLIRKS
ncbi:hypothetical protein [Paenarthrobacter ilicis]|uniref:hypothetical protein n=1 Tax=Paenarthrobacter ilicis TaxID=43665 RepID=UPI0038632705